MRYGAVRGRPPSGMTRIEWGSLEALAYASGSYRRSLGPSLARRAKAGRNVCLESGESGELDADLDEVAGADFEDSGVAVDFGVANGFAAAINDECAAGIADTAQFGGAAVLRDFQAAGDNRIGAIGGGAQAGEEEVGGIEVKKPALVADVGRAPGSQNVGHGGHQAEGGLHGIFAVEGEGQIEGALCFAGRDEDDIEHARAVALVKREAASEQDGVLLV